jgi:hypothetical protein
MGINPHLPAINPAGRGRVVQHSPLDQAAASSGRVIPNRRRPVQERLSTGCRPSPWHVGSDQVGCLCFNIVLSGAWQARNGDHVWEKRCSGLDLFGCDPGPGYAAQDFNTRETELAYRSLRLQDGARAAPSRSPVVCRIVGAPPLCTPARVIPGRTLLEGEGLVGCRSSPQLQSRSSGQEWRLADGPVPVPHGDCDPHFVAIQIAGACKQL